jgi:hypothetical protein
MAVRVEAGIGLSIPDPLRIGRFAPDPPRSLAPKASWPPRVDVRPSRFLDIGSQLIDDGSMRIMVYEEIGGSPHGLPVVMPIVEWNRLRHHYDTSRFLTSQLGREIKSRTGDRGGLIDIKIPFRVPKGLSAITGEGETHLNITARQRMDLSGVSQFTDGEAQSAANRNSKVPTIAFEQESQVNVNGEIGDKITVNLEQNSNRQLDLSESLRLRYTGEEDAIIHTVEAGNTNLNLPGTRLIGFNAGRGGLFGIKGKGKLGGFDLTVVTTQDKGSSNRKTFQGQAEEFSDEIRDFAFMENVYFFFDRVHRRAFPDDPVARELIDINNVDVYINDFNDLNDIEDRAFPGLALSVWTSDGTPDEETSRAQPGGIEEGAFHQLDRSGYQIDPRGYLVLTNTRVSGGSALAVAYRTADGRIFGDVGYIQTANAPRVQLKLLKSKNQTSSSETWDLAWKNVYSLSGRKIEPEGFDLRILKEIPGQEDLDSEGGKPYIQLFELDTHTNNSSASSPPDNRVDTDNGNNIPGLNLLLGHLVFPFLEPFGDAGSDSAPIAEPVPELYTENNRTTRAEKSKYFMRFTSRSRATRFNLAAGVIEGSEAVRLNNRRLVRGTDYKIDYNFGAITFIGDAADQVSDPTANLKIDFDSKDPFGGFGQQKSLLGIRLEHSLDDQFSFLGMTMLYSSQSTPSQRVRVGQEPARTFIWDANARLRYRPQILTDIVNWIPFVNSSQQSQMDIDLEVAQSIPNPNTKGIAYVDDFEGSQEELRFPVFKGSWTQSSTPVRNGRRLDPELVRKGRLTWYTPITRDRISQLEIQPNRTDLTTEQAIIDILQLRFEAARTLGDGQPGFPDRIRDNTRGRPEESWAGIMTNLGGWDLSRSKFLEIWIKGAGGKFHLDLGEISERIDLPIGAITDQFRTEDEPIGGLLTGDGIATAAEDLGLDGLTDLEEGVLFSEKWPGVPVPTDPAGDNFADVDTNKPRGDPDRYPSGINGAQGNSPERNSLPDTEDLNKNGFLDQNNDFVRYSVDLSTNRGLNPETGSYADGISVLVDGTKSDSSSTPWRLIRIPLRGQRAPRTIEGSPDTTFSSLIDFARVWIEHNASREEISIWEFKAVGNDWQEDDQPPQNTSGDFEVSSIGTDNPIYTPPPNLQLEQDPTTGLILTERSLAIDFENLAVGETITASRTFVQGEDYTKYNTMRLFVHGGDNPTTFPAPEDSAGLGLTPIEIILRFSPSKGDSQNVYEFRRGVYQGWESNTLEIDLELLTQLKGQLLDLRTAQLQSDTTTLALSAGELLVDYNRERNQIRTLGPEPTYLVRGNPSLNRIKSFTLALHNRSDSLMSEGEAPSIGQALSGELWVDELTLDGVRKNRAFSALASVRTVIADLGNLNIELERRSGDFQDLQGAASGNTTSRAVLNTDVNLGKFLPQHWQVAIPVRYSYNRTKSVPRIRRGSDIVLTPDQKNNESDVNAQSRLNLTFRKRAARENPRLLSQVFFDRVDASINLVSSTTTNGAITRRRSNKNDQLTGTFNYNLNLPKKKSIKPFKWVPLFKSVKEAELFYLPSTVRYGVRFNRNVRDQRDFSAVPSDTLNAPIESHTENFNLNESYDVKLLPFRSLTANYKLGIDRDLRGALQVSGLQFGHETGRTQNVTVGFTPKIFRWLTTNAQYNANYRETLETGGQKTAIGNLRRGLTVNSQNQASLRLGLNFASFFRGLARPKRNILFRLVGRAGSTINNVNSSIARNKQFGLFGLRERPALGYQFGLSDTADVQAFETGGLTRTNSRTVQDRADIGASVRLPAGFSIQSNANYNHNRTFAQSNAEEKRTTLPDLNVSWRGIERLPVFRWLWTSANVNSSFQKSKTRRGEPGVLDGFFHALDTLTITNDIRTTQLSPMISLSTRWKNGMSTTFQTTNTKTTDLRFQRNIQKNDEGRFPTQAERTIGTTITEVSTLRAQIRYSIKPSIFGSLESNIDLDLSFDTSGNTSLEIPRQIVDAIGSGRVDDAPAPEVDPAAEPDPTIDASGGQFRRNESTVRGTLGAQYRFSSHFTGGMSFGHQRRRDKLRELTNLSFEFRLFGEIEFN